MNEAELDFKSKQSITIKVTLPVLVWEKWNADCKSNFAGTRYLKMLSDHEFKTSFNSIANLIISDLENLRSDVEEIQGELNNREDEPKEKGIKTMGSK